MTRMTGPDCVVMCNLINTYIHTYIHTYILRTAPFSQKCKSLLVDLKPDVVYDDGYRQYEENTGEISDAASLIFNTFAFSEAHVIPIECTRQLLQTADWKNTILPELQKAPVVNSVTFLATQVGIPATKRRTVVVGVKQIPDAKDKLAVWR